jgi:hypothetical protein
MQRDLREHVSGSLRNLSLAVGPDVWQLYVYGVTRVGRELFIQTALLGPRTCTATVRVTAGVPPRQTARQVLELIREWILSGDECDHVFLEAADSALATC